MSKRFTKYRKVRSDKFAWSRGAEFFSGIIGLKALKPGKITKKQIESARVVISRACGKKGRISIRKNIFFPVTKKPLEVRMGGGKGPIDNFVCRVKGGDLIFELDNVSNDVAVKALNKAMYKLNIPCEIAHRRFVSVSM